MWLKPLFYRSASVAARFAYRLVAGLINTADVKIIRFLYAGPDGANVEAFYETGQTLVEAVKKTLNSIKGRASDAKTEVSEVAPF